MKIVVRYSYRLFYEEKHMKKSTVGLLLGLATVSGSCFRGGPTEPFAIYVDGQLGNDQNIGSRFAPKKTIMGGLEAAAITHTNQVFVAGGLYRENVVLQDGVSVFGGFNPLHDWHRPGEERTVLRNVLSAGEPSVGLYAQNITQPTIVSDVTIETVDGDVLVNPEQSTYGLYCFRCENLALDQVVILAGQGADGRDGTAGASGAPGAPGQNVVASDCMTARAGGTPGTPGDLGTPGGTGGQGGAGMVLSGTVGQTVGGVIGGTGGMGGTMMPSAGGTGANGTLVTLEGTAGTRGEGGQIDNHGFWHSNPGQPGGPGRGGLGGAGGGGGGAYQSSGMMPITMPGGSGGGGGGGGGEGLGGLGGHGAGGSFGVFAVQSEGLVITNSDIRSRNGGRGGNGGNGGPGNKGGTGGSGGAGASGCSMTMGSGAMGGKGGDGSAGTGGGGGGGGSGGPSYAVFTSPSTQILAGRRNILHNGQGGSGGLGGTVGARGDGEPSLGTVAPSGADGSSGDFGGP